ncbi:MAG: FtsX-like permease family protein [Corynebacterium sp.]|nr:FtsX-like permease family protein [Corynebacterium sp.]
MQSSAHSRWTEIVAATRPMRRDMFSKPLRLIAAVLLILIPVAIATSEAINTQSLSALSSGSTVIDGASESTSAERFTGEISFYGSDASCQQNGTGSQQECTSATGEPIYSSWPTPLPSEIDTAASHLPAGTKMDTEGQISPTFLKGEASSSGDVKVLSSPALLDNIPEEKRPAAGEILLSQTTARELKASIGDDIGLRYETRAGVSTQTLHISDITPTWDSMVLADSLPGEVTYPYLYVRYSSPTQVTWQQVETLNAEGMTLTSAQAVANAPEHATADLSHSTTDRAYAIVGTVFAIMFWLSALAIFMLFIAPIFAIAFSRHTTLFAFMLTQGATPRHIRLAVLTFGFFAAVIGIVLGTVLGGAYEIGRWTINFPGWPVAIPWGRIAIIVSCAFVVTLAAAMAPAILIARNSLATAIHGAAPDRIIHWRKWMTIGPVLVATSLLGMLANALLHFHVINDLIAPVALVACVFLLICGIALSGPALIVLIRIITRNIGFTSTFAWRCSGRFLARRSLHAIPAIAIITVLTVAAAYFTVDAETNERANAAQRSAIHPDNFGFFLKSSARTHSDQLKAVQVESDLAYEMLDGTRRIPLRGTVQMTDEYDKDLEHRVADDDTTISQSITFEIEGANVCHVNDVKDITDSFGKSAFEDPVAAQACSVELGDRSASSPLTYANASSYILSSTDIDLFTFRNEEEKLQAQRVLDAGGVLVPFGAGAGELDTTTVVAKEGTALGDDHTPPVLSTVGSATLPIAEVLPKEVVNVIIFSPAAADALSLAPIDLGMAIEFAQVPDKQALMDFQDIIYHQAAFTGTDAPYLDIAGDHDYYGWVMSTLLTIYGLIAFVLLLILVLSAAGQRRDALTLQAIGATPATTALLAATQTWLLATTAMVTGTVVGHIISLVHSTPMVTSAAGIIIDHGTLPYFRISWLSVMWCLIVPLVGAAMAWVFHGPGLRKNLASARRSDGAGALS